MNLSCKHLRVPRCMVFCGHFYHHNPLLSSDGVWFYVCDRHEAKTKMGGPQLG